MSRNLVAVMALSFFISGCGVGLNQKEVTGSPSTSTKQKKKPVLVPAEPVKGDIDKVICVFPEALSTKIERVSAQFLGKPYSGNGPLGEGQTGKYDRDPLSRNDTFDCTTYVETVIARAVSNSEAEFQSNINKIRYKNSEVSFVSRNHFPSLDWIPNNIEAGFLRDITAEVAGNLRENLETASAEIDKSQWYWDMKPDRIQGINAPTMERMFLWADLRMEGVRFRPENATLPYIPLTALFPEKDNPDQDQIDVLSDILSAKEAEHAEMMTDPETSEERKAKLKEAFTKLKANLEIQILALKHDVNYAIFERIPSGAVVNIVRPNWDLKKWIGTNMNVSHQAFVIRRGNSLLLRHASSGNGNRVVDEDLLPYLLKYVNHESIKGINLLEVMDPNVPDEIEINSRMSDGASGFGNACAVPL